jgi:hypothetical protein
VKLPTNADVRGALTDADRPLYIPEIWKEIGIADGTEQQKKRGYGALRQMTVSGELVRHHSAQGLSYSINPAFLHAPPTRGRKAKNASTAPKFAKGSEAAPAERAPKAQATKAKPKSESRVTPQSTSKNAHAPASAYHTPAAVSSSIAKPSDFDLRRRLDAIGTDLADAIADACDAEHPHGLIKALVVSREAVARAQAALPR